jgi:hypothetical protein
MAVVVFPTPPFWFAIAMMRAIGVFHVEPFRFSFHVEPSSQRLGQDWSSWKTHAAVPRFSFSMRDALAVGALSMLVIQTTRVVS